jgi:hypothetical protein
MRKYSYWLLVAAVVFIIVQDPTSTGALIRDFFSWIGEGVSAMFEFLGSLLGQSGADAGTVIPPPLPSPSVIVPSPSTPDQAGLVAVLLVSQRRA